MTDTNTAPGAKPTHRVYNVTGEGKAATWAEIGAAWPTRDGDAFSIRLNAVPLVGRMVMRRITERTAKAGQQ